MKATNLIMAVLIHGVVSHLAKMTAQNVSVRVTNPNARTSLKLQLDVFTIMC